MLPTFKAIQSAKLFLTTGLLAAVLVAPAFAAETYEIDAAHTQIGFSVKHLAVSNVKGHFKTFSGTIQYNDKDLSKSSVEVSIDTASITTDNEKRDQHLMSKDFFDAAKFPKLTFKSKKIEKKGNDLIATGDLTMHGVTKEVQIPFTLSGPITDPWQGNKHIGVEGGLTINRQNWGVSWNDHFGAGELVVGDDVKINLEVEAILAKPAAAPAKK